MTVILDLFAVLGVVCVACVVMMVLLLILDAAVEHMPGWLERRVEKILGPKPPPIIARNNSDESGL